VVWRILQSLSEAERDVVFVSDLSQIARNAGNLSRESSRKLWEILEEKGLGSSSSIDFDMFVQLCELNPDIWSWILQLQPAIPVEEPLMPLVLTLKYGALTLSTSCKNCLCCVSAV
jgi:hypothetical protein